METAAKVLPPITWIDGIVIASTFSAISCELLVATYATILLGSPVRQYSLLLSTTFAAMGLGRLAARGGKRYAVPLVISLESAQAWSVMAAMPAIYFGYAHGRSPGSIPLAFAALIGAGMGAKSRLLGSLRQNGPAAQLLIGESFGALAAALAFPLYLLPRLGLFRVAGVLGLLSGVAAVGLCLVFQKEVRKLSFWSFLLVLTLAASGFFLFSSEWLKHVLQARLFNIGSLS